MLHVFAKADAAGMRAYGEAELCGHQDDREILIHSAQTAAINVDEIDPPGLHELLEENAIGAVFTGGNTHGMNGPGDRGMAQDIVRVRRFLNPPWAEFRKSLHGGDG